MYRTFLTAFAVSAAVSTATVTGDTGPVRSDSIDLTELRWQARPILIFADADDPRLAQQLAKFETARSAMEDRDTVVIVVSEADAPLRRRFQPDAFTVILIGKDGGEKLRRDGLVDPATLGDLIDTMPMRRQEILRNGD